MLSFRNRLLILLIGLVVGAQIVTLFTALARTASEERQRADAQLVRGAEIARRDLANRERQLASVAAVLGADYGLSAAVTEGHAPTLTTALDNHANRIGADLTLALDLDGQLIGSGSRAPADTAEIVAALNRSQMRDQPGATFIRAGSSIYQVVSAPVLAPDEVGSVVLGFSVDQALAEQLKRLVDAEVAFLAGAAGGMQLTAGTAALNAAGAFLLPSLRAAPTEVNLQGRQYLATATHLTETDPPLDVALLKPMEEVNAPFAELARMLGAIFAMSLALAVVAGVYLGRSAARPVQKLAEGAARIAAGDYSQPMESAGGQELAHLASAFNSMQSGIAEREARLKHLALHDAATGLPNRVHLIQWLDGRLPDAQGRAAYAVIQCILTNLQEVSATLGFGMADRLLAHCARQLAGAAREGGLVARVGGAEFAVALPLGAREDPLALAGRIGVLCAEAFTTEGIALRATVVTGISVAPADAARAEEALRCAHAAAESALAMHQSMARFVQASDEAQRRRLKLGAELPRALQEGQLYLLYQPKQRLSDGAICGVEALARWRHPVFGEVSPVEFVPIAERTGASAQLTRWVLRTALGQLRHWHTQGRHISMAVNLSAADLLDHNLLQDILGALRDTGLPAGSLTLEVTESVLLHDAQTVRGNIQLLRVAGVRFSIDDFGTGYSSLSQLRELAADELKIDRSFVSGALGGKEGQVMLRAIVQMAYGMGLATVAEGVEHESQLQLLNDLGCDQAQGYLISRPAAPAELAPLLNSAAPARREHRDGAVTALRPPARSEAG